MFLRSWRRSRVLFGRVGGACGLRFKCLHDWSRGSSRSQRLGALTSGEGPSSPAAIGLGKAVGMRTSRSLGLLGSLKAARLDRSAQAQSRFTPHASAKPACSVGHTGRKPDARSIACFWGDSRLRFESSSVRRPKKSPTDRLGTNRPSASKAIRGNCGSRGADSCRWLERTAGPLNRPRLRF